MSGTNLQSSTALSAATGIRGAPSARRQRASARRVAVYLSALVAILMLVASAGGLLGDGLYRDALPTSSMLRAYDLVTLVVVVPALAASLLGVRRGNPLAELVWV